MKKEQTVKKNNNKKTPRNKKHFFPEMHTRAAAQLFFFFIRHKEGDGGFWKLGGKFFRQHLTRGLPATPYLFLPASSNLLCSAEWK